MKQLMIAMACAVACVGSAMAYMDVKSDSAIVIGPATVTVADYDGQTLFSVANMTTATDGKFGALATWITDSAGSTSKVYTHGVPVVGTVTATSVGGNNAAIQTSGPSSCSCGSK